MILRCVAAFAIVLAMIFATFGLIMAMIAGFNFLVALFIAGVLGIAGGVALAVLLDEL